MLALLEIGFAEVSSIRDLETITIRGSVHCCKLQTDDRHHRAAGTSTSMNGMLRLAHVNPPASWFGFRSSRVFQLGNNGGDKVVGSLSARTRCALAYAH